MCEIFAEPIYCNPAVLRPHKQHIIELNSLVLIVGVVPGFSLGLNPLEWITATRDSLAQAMQKHQRQARAAQDPPPATLTRLPQGQRKRGTTSTPSSWLHCLLKSRLRCWNSREGSAACARGNASNKKLQLLPLLR